MKGKCKAVLLLAALSASPALGQIYFPHPVSGAVNSGGVACFDTPIQMSSSPTLAANSVMLGGGKGGCPTTNSGLTSSANGDLTANSLFTDLVNSNGANDLVVEDDSVERLRLQSGHPTISLTFNKPAGYIYPNEPGNGTSPSPATVEIFSASTDHGLNGPFDQLSLTNPFSTNRRAAIMLQSYCDRAIVTSCVPSSQVDEWEIGVDLAPNGSRNFFIYDEVNGTANLSAGPYQTVSLGTTAAVGGVGNPSGSGIQGDVTVRRLNAAGGIPVCSLGVGWGSGASCDFQGGSTDTAGMLRITTGASPGSSGTFTVTWSGGSNFGQNNTAVCVANLVNHAVPFNPRATAILESQSLQMNQWTVDNNGESFAPFTNFAYGVTYICIGK